MPLPQCKRGFQGFSMLEFKSVDKFRNSILVHTATVRVSSLYASSRDDGLLNLVGFNPNPRIYAGFWI